MDLMGFDLFLPPPWPDRDADHGGDDGGAPTRPGAKATPGAGRDQPGGAGRDRPGDAKRAGAAGATRSGMGGALSPAPRGALSPVSSTAGAGGAATGRRPPPVPPAGQGRLELQAAAESYVDHNLERVRRIVSAWLQEP